MLRSDRFWAWVWSAQEDDRVDNYRVEIKESILNPEIGVFAFEQIFVINSSKARAENLDHNDWHRRIHLNCKSLKIHFSVLKYQVQRGENSLKYGIEINSLSSNHAVPLDPETYLRFYFTFSKLTCLVRVPVTSTPIEIHCIRERRRLKIIW